MTKNLTIKSYTNTGDFMKIIIKRIILVLLIALFFSFLIFKAYHADEKEYKEISILQAGAYKSYDNVIKNTRHFENFIVFKEDNLYKIFIAVSQNDEIFNKLKNLYASNIQTFKKTIKVNNKDFIKKIDNYDKIIKNTENKTNINIVTKESLKLLEKLLHNNL